MKHNPKLTTRAQFLRNNMTKEERKLWYEFLNTYPHKFHRQVTVGPYILDFYCAAAKLAVELDGSQHYEQEGKHHDAVRTNYLNSLGIEVLRFPNSDITKNLRGVCRMIDLKVKERSI